MRFFVRLLPIVAFVTVWIIAFFQLYSIIKRIDSINPVANNASAYSASKRLLLDWSNKPPARIWSKNVHEHCMLDGQPICCALLDKENETATAVEQAYFGSFSRPSHHHNRHVPISGNIGIGIGKVCHTKRKYIPSQYEEKHFAQAAALSKVADSMQRLDQLVQFILDDIDASNIWLARVKLHMQAGEYPEITPDDYQYLSRFEVTKTCNGGVITSSSSDSVDSGKSSNGDVDDPSAGFERTGFDDRRHHASHPQQQQHQWIEWIEPLTVHGRHPFAFVDCMRVFERMAPPPHMRPYMEKILLHRPQMRFKSSLTGTDYVLLQSGVALLNHTIAGMLPYHAHGVSSQLFQNHHQPQQLQPAADSQGMSQQQSHPSLRAPAQFRYSRHFMFDAGSSTFDSSLVWFVCGYLQRSLEFDQIFGWEYSLLEPNQFWDLVPGSLTAIYHFFNVPVPPDSRGRNSPIRLIKKIATEDDFVAFKLDIDTPSVEIPLALALSQDPEVTALVDEFFFELHFQCELMGPCGWGSDIPDEVLGQKMDRLSAMQLFRTLRDAGVRAHMWP